jgi:hypothetical protein
MVAVPSPLSLKRTPVGRAPVSLRAGAGDPVVVIKKEPATCSVKVAVLPEVRALPRFTVRVKDWLTLAPLLDAVKVSPYVPCVPTAGVPLRVPVPLPLSVNVTPLGGVPPNVKAAVGIPEVVTVNEPGAPSVKVVLLPLVITGFTISTMDAAAVV